MSTSSIKGPPEASTITSSRGHRLVVAVASPPAIVCPPWCRITEEEHQQELPEWEGFVIHHSRLLDPQRWSMSLAQTTFVDGRPAPERDGEVHLFIGDDLYVPAEALALVEAFAADVRGLAEEARA